MHNPELKNKSCDELGNLAGPSQKTTWPSLTPISQVSIFAGPAVHEACAAEGKWHQVGCAWLLSLLREGLLLKKRREDQWYFSLGPMGGVVASIGLPVQFAQTAAGAVVKFDLPIQEESLKWLVAFDLDDWSARSVQWTSPLSQMVRLGRSDFAPAIIGVVGTAELSLLVHAARHCFWDIPVVGLKQIAQHLGIVVSGANLCAVLSDLIETVLPDISADERVSIIEMRLRGSRADEEATTVLRTDFVREGLASSDQKEVARIPLVWWRLQTRDWGHGLM